MSYTASSTGKQIDFTKPVLVYCHTHGTVSVPTPAEVQTKQTSAETGGTRNATIVPNKQHTVYIPPQPLIAYQWVMLFCRRHTTFYGQVHHMKII